MLVNLSVGRLAYHQISGYTTNFSVLVTVHGGQPDQWVQPRRAFGLSTLPTNTWRNACPVPDGRCRAGTGRDGTVSKGTFLSSVTGRFPCSHVSARTPQPSEKCFEAKHYQVKRPV